MEAERLPQGTGAWFEMVGALMSAFAEEAALPADLNVSFVERYVDGGPVGDGLVQGIRFELRGGRPSFRVGVRPDERGDVNVEVTAAAARKLNSLRAADPAYAAAVERLAAGGEFRVEGDVSRLGSWLERVHDPIVERTL